jgi:TatD DNase family protein
VGCSSLDNFRSSNACRLQPRAFVGQLKIARDLQKPIQLHVRSHIKDEQYRADGAALDILCAENMSQHPMHRHCFFGDWELAKKWLTAAPNTYFGFTNAVYNDDRAHARLSGVIKELPLDRILIETDAPFFTPKLVREFIKYDHNIKFVQYKGSSDIAHPGHALLVARFIADTKGLTLDAVATQLAENTKRLYSI